MYFDYGKNDLLYQSANFQSNICNVFKTKQNIHFQVMPIHKNTFVFQSEQGDGLLSTCFKMTMHTIL